MEAEDAEIDAGIEDEVDGDMVEVDDDFKR